jgi:acyl carrier protein phosphodiesterase
VVIDIDPISAVPGVTDDLVRDQPQIDVAPRRLGTSGAQVPPCSSSSPRLPRRSINWNQTPWQKDWFEDNEDMQALQTSIVTINIALTVSVPLRVVCLLDRT